MRAITLLMTMMAMEFVCYGQQGGVGPAAQWGNGSITGNVVADANGAALAGVSVTLELNAGQPYKKASTDAAGAYTFTGLAVFKNYRLVFSKNGYLTAYLNVKVNAGAAAAGTVRLSERPKAERPDDGRHPDRPRPTPPPVVVVPRDPVPDTVTLKGSVFRFPDRLAISGVEISIDHSGLKAYTDRFGKFMLSGIPRNTSVKVVFSKAGFLDEEVVVAMSGNRSINVAMKALTEDMLRERELAERRRVEEEKRVAEEEAKKRAASVPATVPADMLKDKKTFTYAGRVLDEASKQPVLDAQMSVVLRVSRVTDDGSKEIITVEKTGRTDKDGKFSFDFYLPCDALELLGLGGAVERDGYEPLRTDPVPEPGSRDWPILFDCQKLSRERDLLLKRKSG